MSCQAAASNRPPAAAGAFYPGKADELRAQVVALLDGAGSPARDAIAFVAPHAGYVFSGRVAAQAFARLDPSSVHRVILLGPSHHRSFSGGALPAQGLAGFETPLGVIAIDRAAVDALRGMEGFGGPPGAHDPEHSLEVELPFVQVAAPGAAIVPVLIGSGTDRVVAADVARGLAKLLEPGTVVVVSSDFSHHGQPYGWAPFPVDRQLGNRLLSLGRATAECLARGYSEGFWQQVEVSGDTVCGKRPLSVLGELLDHAFEGSGSVVDVTTSGHVSGMWDRSVTYAAIVYSGKWHTWKEAQPAPALGVLNKQQGRALVELARATLRSHLGHDGSLATWSTEHNDGEGLMAPAGAFVTVHNQGERARREGRLRACMGVIEARQPLLDAVIHAAVSAAHDPRFPPLTLDELDDVDLEVSALSAPRPVPSADSIKVGEHGVILSKLGRRAVFLPQVATEQGWDRDTMLAHLARKAGLGADDWREGAQFEVFTAQVVAEEQ